MFNQRVDGVEALWSRRNLRLVDGAHLAIDGAVADKRLLLEHEVVLISFQDGVQIHHLFVQLRIDDFRQHQRALRTSQILVGQVRLIWQHLTVTVLRERNLLHAFL